MTTNLNIFSIEGLLLFVISSCLAFIIFKNAKTKIHRVWGLFNVSVAIWAISAFFIGISKTESNAILWWRVSHLGITFIPIFLFHVIYLLCNLDNRRFLVFVYTQGIFFLILSLSGTILFLPSVRFVFSSFYYAVLGPLYHPSFIVWLFLVLYSHYKLFILYRNSQGIKKNQVIYLLVGFASGFIGGVTNFLPAYKIDIYPYGNFGICLYCLIATYAILKYRILDIKLAFTRVGVFGIVYTLVLGIPFWIGFKFLGRGMWILPVSIMAVFATFGPFIYLYLQRRAENILLRTQRQYQQALRDLSKSIVRLRNIEQLFDTITHQVVYSVKVSYAAMYFKDSQNKEFILKSEYYNHKIPSPHSLPKEVSSSDPFIAYLENAERPIIVEEEKFKLNHSFFNIDAGLVVPCITKMGLTGIIFLGNKPNNQLYTEDDILTFDTLAAQASLAIENCQFAQELADKERVARLQDMDVYSYSLAHEIDNPVQIIKTGVGYLQTQLLKELTFPEVIRKDINESLNLILEAARRISGMVQAIRDYGSTINEDFKPLKIEEVVDSFSNIVNYRFRDKSIIFTKEVGVDLGYVRGQKPELIQVLEIFANNSIHAMSQCEVKKAHLKVFQTNPDTIRITFTDTGYGIDNKILHLIFSPFTTTKASSEGTGMGLANAKKIVERHKGKIWAESEGKDKGATFIIELPVAKDISQEEFKKGDKGKMIF